MLCVQDCKLFKGKNPCFYCLLSIAEALPITQVFADILVTFGFSKVYFSTQDGKAEGGACRATSDNKITNCYHTPLCVKETVAEEGWLASTFP